MNNTPSLLGCPFCGGGETHIHVNKGTWNGRGYGEPVSVEVRHWCESELCQPSRMISRVGRDEASAIAAWNRRTPQPVVREQLSEKELAARAKVGAIRTDEHNNVVMNRNHYRDQMEGRFERGWREAEKHYGITQKGGSNAPQHQQ